jgi:phosphoglycolate phosphatase
VLRAEAAHLGWTRHFRRIVGAGDAARDKPDAAPVHVALAGSGISSAATWYVGDTALDMECAGNAGCAGVLLGADGLADAGVARFRPALHFHDCAALERHLRAL